MTRGSGSGHWDDSGNWVYDDGSISPGGPGHWDDSGNYIDGNGTPHPGGPPDAPSNSPLPPASTQPPKNDGKSRPNWIDDPTFEKWWKAQSPDNKWLPDVWQGNADLRDFMEAQYQRYRRLQQADTTVVKDTYGPPAGYVPPTPAPAPRGYSNSPGSSINDFSDAAGGSQGFYEAPPPFEYPDFVPPSFDAPEWTPPADFSYADYVAPDPFSYAEFSAPTGEQVLAEDPGFAFRKAQGENSVVNSAAAQGMARSGQSLADLMTFGQGLASQEYDAAWGRKKNAYDTNRANAADTWDKNTGLGLTTYNTNRGNAADTWDKNYKGALTDYSLGYGKETDEYGRALDTYKTNLGKEGMKYGYLMDIASNKAGVTSDWFDKLLSLYDISSRNLPTYAPSAGY